MMRLMRLIDLFCINHEIFIIEKIIALLKEMAIMSYCKHKNIAQILAIYFYSKEELVWII